MRVPNASQRAPAERAFDARFAAGDVQVNGRRNRPNSAPPNSETLRLSAR